MFSASKTAGPSGYNINNSLRFRSSASAYLSRTPASAGSQTTWTYSVWVKRGSLSATQSLLSAHSGNPPFANFYIDSTNTINYDFDVGTRYSGNTTAVFRDPSAWYHIVMVFNSTQATAANRFIVYVNNVQYSVGTITFPQNTTPPINAATTHNIGRRSVATDNYLDGYLAEVNFINGQALTPSSFGSTNATTGVWQPAKYTGTYGTNGFYLPFSDIATTSGSNAGLGKDFSGNSNYWTTNNISVTAGTTYDAMTDVPTNTSATVANYAVLNPLDKSTNITTSNANLKITGSGTAWDGIRSSIGVSSGKWYFEITVNSNNFATNGLSVGIMQATNVLTAVNLVSFTGAGCWLYNNVDTGSVGRKANNGVAVTYGASWTTNDVIGCAFDCDAGSIEFYKNNVSQGVAYSSQTFGTVFPFISVYVTDAGSINFGQQGFTYTPPSGYNRLNTYNLPTPTILQGNKYMDATLYTGTNANQTIVNAGAFKPDFVWVKSRSVGGNPVLVDSVRGANKVLYSPQTTAEETPTAGTGILSFNSNGFGLGTDISGTSFGATNTNGTTFVGWQWQAGQGSTSSNTSGSITSTVSVNTTAGFSIVTYTGTGALGTVGHGLGVAPSMLIIKSRSAIDTWRVYHASLGNTKYINLNDTSAAGTASTVWNNTSPTSSVFTINTESSVNGSGRTQVAYCWAEIAGFSKFGSYTGNGSTDGPFIFTGFRPKFVMIKCTSNADSWYMLDTSRSTYNATNQRLFANASSAESSGDAMDILSNGFKNRSNTTINNLNGGTYIYMAFAENPFKNALAR